MHIEWTAQHSCGNANTRCEFIIQYTCDPKIRDGTNENTIPIDDINCNDFDCDGDPMYGRQESLLSYRQCRWRTRNKGLFTAGQLNPNAQQGAIRTRQNPNAQRYGYECAEERDYYPYWHPTIWRDVAVLTNEPQRCNAYMSESENVKGRWYCDVPQAIITARNNAEGYIPINKIDCEKLTTKVGNTTYTARWVPSSPHNIPPPLCRQNIYTRDNHLGNTIGGYPLSFNWTLPTHAIGERCVLRLRYNITTTDFEGFESLTSVQSGYVNSSYNVNGNNRPTPLDMWSKFGMTENENGLNSNKDNELTTSRGYRYKNDPQVDIFGELLYPSTSTNRVKLALAINTAQFGRTFQDRSHRFAVRPRPSYIPEDAMIHNINVRGKRGNIVQVYPAVEYDFHPNRVTVALGDYVHFQWTGSNTNPNNNDGQGNPGTDRSNVVGLARKTFAESNTLTNPPTYHSLGTNHPQRLGIDIPATPGRDGSSNFLGWSNRTLIQLATLGAPGGQFGGDMDEFDDAGTYFDLGPQLVSKMGIYNYMCTRNNNFSNRSQKGIIVVTSTKATSELIGWNGGWVGAGNAASLEVPQGTFSSVQQVSVTVTPSTVALGYDNTKGIKIPSVESVSSDVIHIAGSTDRSLGGNVKLTIQHTASPLADTVIMYTPQLGEPWVSLSAEVGATTATVWTDKPGAYVVSAPLNSGAIAGIVVGGVVLIGLATFLIIYCRKKAVRAASYEPAPSDGSIQKV